MRKSFDPFAEVAVEQEKSSEPAHKPCTECGQATPHGVLVMYGARCTRCYEHYLQHGSRWTAADYARKRK